MFRPFFIVLLFITLAACRQKSGYDLNELIQKGEFGQAEFVLSQKIGESRNDSLLQEKYIVELETLRRIRKEFPYKRADVKKQFEKYYPNLRDEDLDKWETSGELEMKVIDGEKRYFSRAVGNFFRINPEAKKLKESIDGESYSGVEAFQQEVIPTYFEEGIADREPFSQQKLKITYSVKVDANAVPAGETVRCWLPYPKMGIARSSKVELLQIDGDVMNIAPTTVDQRSVYLEKKAVKDETTVFQVAYTVQTAAQWFDVKPEEAKPYDVESALYKKYTSEQLPHIVFNDDIKALAQQIVGAETNPVSQVKLLYFWINDNIPWAGALEYSVMKCIPEYVLEHHRGDCGMQTFLFLSMARSIGIPCKWQSGWYLLPQEKNLHDWAEVYYEGIGWVPVDPSFKLIDSDDIRVREFYLNGMDPYRLIINDDVAAEFMPKKKYYRSEPYDFQRGELEWKGGNLYFDTWSYHLDVEYLTDH
ncbi:transglutaminase-like domain-containing protein [Maribellus sediminis]|uniref:transglutaminase-like domain-containing protein n=1 Tax=Maribellus sediminis TaxID=2696285 RepID=UPI001431B28C|nr:transglutaminase domain-containing protein [Maribellus sediminis]